MPPRFVAAGVSEKNEQGKRAARDRLVQQRERQRASERRRRTLIVSSAVVGVLALAAVVGVIAANSGGKDKSGAAGPAVAPSGATGKDSLAIRVGADNAPSTLTIWEDFRCPVCAQFENAFRDTVHQLENTGQIKVEYHLATIIDGNLGGSGSLRAANAAACAQDAGRFPAYHDVLYRNQPQETDDAFGDNAKLIELGEGPGARHLRIPQLCGGRQARQLGQEVQHGVPERRLPGHADRAAQRGIDLPEEGRRADHRGESEEVGDRGQQGQEAGHGHPGAIGFLTAARVSPAGNR